MSLIHRLSVYYFIFLYYEVLFHLIDSKIELPADSGVLPLAIYAQILVAHIRCITGSTVHMER